MHEKNVSEKSVSIFSSHSLSWLMSQIQLFMATYWKATCPGLSKTVKLVKLRNCTKNEKNIPEFLFV